MEESTPVIKKTARTRKTASVQSSLTDLISSTPSTTNVSESSTTKLFEELTVKIAQNKQGYESLQRQIEQTRQEWVREQKQYEMELSQQKDQGELERKRENETYQYNTVLARKRAEDEFQDRKLSWEKDLERRKEELENQKRELEDLRKLSAGFDEQTEKATKEALDVLERELTDKFNQEKKLREQEVKAEKDILGLKIANLEAENSRLNKEMEILKRSLDEATKQVREIAVKVIESGQPKNHTPSVVDKTS